MFAEYIDLRNNFCLKANCTSFEDNINCGTFRVNLLSTIISVLVSVNSQNSTLVDRIFCFKQSNKRAIFRKSNFAIGWFRQSKQRSNWLFLELLLIKPVFVSGDSQSVKQEERSQLSKVDESDLNSNMLRSAQKHYSTDRISCSIKSYIILMKQAEHSLLTAVKIDQWKDSPSYFFKFIKKRQFEIIAGIVLYCLI